MLLPLLFLTGAQAITYDEMKEYNCYTLRGSYSRNDMICGAAIEEDKQCEEMCRTRDTVARLYPNPPREFTLARGEHLCHITFTGRCATAAFGRDSSDLCLTIGRRKLIDGEIDRFWLGGGSIFFRTCRDPSQGKTEEVAVMYMITEHDRQFLGYSTTRVTSDRAPYICATRYSRNEGNSCLGTVVQVPTEPTVATPPTTPSTPPTTPSTRRTTPPPRCSLEVSHKVGTAIVTCFNDGALKLGDKLVFSGTTPSCCPAIWPQDSVWSFNLYSRDQAPWLHVTVKMGWNQLFFTSAPYAWGAWLGGWYLPCPFRPESSFTVEITNNQNTLDMLLNGQTYTYNHPFPGDRSNQYFYLAFAGFTTFKVKEIAVIRNGVRDEIGLGYCQDKCVLPA